VISSMDAAAMIATGMLHLAKWTLSMMDVTIWVMT